MYHNFFIHSPVDGYLGCFHVIAIINSAAVNNGIHVSFSVFVSSGYMPRSRIAGSYGNSSPSFLRNLHPVFHSGCINLHSHQQCKCSLFSTPSPAFIVSRFFDDGHSDCCEVIPHCSFGLPFSNNERCWASFHVLVICMSSLEKWLFRSFSHFLIGLFYFSGVELYELLVYFGNCILWQLFHLLLFSSILRAVFSLCL